MEFRDIVNNLRVQRKHLIMGMKMIQESKTKYPRELMDRMEVIVEDIDSFVETYKDIINKQKIDKQLVYEEQQKKKNYSKIVQSAKANRAKDNWDVRVDEKNNVIKVSYNDYNRENVVKNVMEHNIKSYMKKLKSDFPELIFESKRYNYLLVGYPTSGQNNYEVNFEIEVKNS